ncbi:tetratricopeptide repeat protein, partial [Elusimicrobiota bacterium]
MIPTTTLKKDPKDSQALTELAQSQIAHGQYPQAVQSAESALEASPQNAAAHVLSAIAYEQMGEEGRKLNHLSIAAAQDPVRFNEHLQKAKAGERLFDPSVEDSWFLLEAVVASRERTGGGLPPWIVTAFLVLLSIVVVGVFQ